MTNTEELIKIAIENGWWKIEDITDKRIEVDENNDGRIYRHFRTHNESDMFSRNKSDVLLDPLFWSALGKGLGWKDYDRSYNQADQLEVERVYLKHWHRFIDHLAEGGSIEDYAGKLLSK